MCKALILKDYSHWRHIQWLAPFDKVGNLLVERITKVVGRFWNSRSDKVLSDNGRIMISLGILILAKLILAGLLKCFV